ncbi:MAG: glycosyltransferase [Candidatus Bathyarchaeia archaeon]
MKICFVSSYPPNRARLSEYAENLIEELAKRRSISKIYVLADVASGAQLNDLRGKIEVRRVWNPDGILSILKILLHLVKLNPDIVHFNVHFQSFGKKRIPNFIGLTLPFLCKVAGIPSLVSIHNLGEKVHLKILGIKASFLNKLGIRIATKLITLATAVTVTVRSYVETLRNRYQCKSVIFVPHGTRVLCARNSPSVNPHKIVLMFGHMSPSKGLPTMLEVADRLSKDRDDFKVVIAGQSHPNFPDYLDKFRGPPLPNLEFTGYIVEDRIPELFQKAFVVVLPYLTATGTSGVFHLACGFGKPIVASDLPEIRELVREGASALLVSPNDGEGFCKAILRLYDEPDLVKEMEKQNISFASKENWSEVVSSFERIYVGLGAE